MVGRGTEAGYWACVSLEGGGGSGLERAAVVGLDVVVGEGGGDSAAIAGMNAVEDVSGENEVR
jgi:hypothetical protein